MRISDWSSDVCSSDLLQPLSRAIPMHPFPVDQAHSAPVRAQARNCQRRQPTNRRKRPCVATVISSRRYPPAATKRLSTMQRSEEHTSELQSLMRKSSAVFCLKKQINYSHAYAHQTTHQSY